VQALTCHERRFLLLFGWHLVTLFDASGAAFLRLTAARIGLPGSSNHLVPNQGHRKGKMPAKCLILHGTFRVKQKRSVELFCVPYPVYFSRQAFEGVALLLEVGVSVVYSAHAIEHMA
jgi:hypothetical protein